MSNVPDIEPGPKSWREYERLKKEQGKHLTRSECKKWWSAIFKHAGEGTKWISHPSWTTRDWMQLHNFRKQSGLPTGKERIHWSPTPEEQAVEDAIVFQIEQARLERT